jgi:hypothetical protein
MLSLRNRFGIPGVISVIALVFAMLGGAYAANNSSGGGKATASKAGKRGPRGPKGATGPAGPAGAQGPAGANGKDGANGTNGSPGAPGTPGKSVSVSEIEAGELGCEERGGAEVKQEGAGSGIEVCNGTEGSPWVVGAAPPGTVLKGTWALPQYNASSSLESIPVPLSSGVPIAGIATGSGLAFIVHKGVDLPGESTSEREEIEQFYCPGSAENPLPPLAPAEAPVCVYVAKSTNIAANPPASLVSGGGLVALPLSFNSGSTSGYGSWSLITG